MQALRVEISDAEKAFLFSSKYSPIFLAVSRFSLSAKSAMASLGKPCWRSPKKSPGPRWCRSASAILKPSFVLQSVSRRSNVSGFLLSLTRIQ